MSIDDSSEKEFAIRKSYRGDGKKRYETVLAVNIFIFILTSNHIKKSTQLLFLLKSIFISTHETRALPTCKKSNKHFCYCIIARMFSASSFLANGAQHPFVSLSSSSTKKKTAEPEQTGGAQEEQPSESKPKKRWFERARKVSIR